MPCRPVGDKKPVLEDGVWLAPGAWLSGEVFLSERVNVWDGAVIRGDLAPIRIGRETNIQDAAVLHVDDDFPLTIGARCTVGHSAILHGCDIEDEVLIGMASIVMNGARIGRGSLIAAGALVREGSVIPPFSLVAGLPARILRQIPEEEALKERAASVERYLSMVAAHKGGQA